MRTTRLTLFHLEPPGALFLFSKNTDIIFMIMKIYKENRQKKIFIGLSVLIFIISVFGTIEFLIYSHSNSVLSKINQTILDNERSVETSKAIIAKRNEPVYITLPGADRIRALVDNYEADDSIWALVSKTHPISTDYIPEKIKIPEVKTRTDKSDEERSVRGDMEPALIEMFSAAEADGYYLLIGSGYRSADLQAIYFNSLANSIGEEAANQSIARPGQSEHQTALATDISTITRECYISNCFATTDEGIWLAANSFKYGFVLRYPEGKESITGYSYEPWHFRYVGVDLATALHSSGLTLDEAWPYLEKALATLKSNGAIK